MFKYSKLWNLLKTHFRVKITVIFTVIFLSYITPISLGYDFTVRRTLIFFLFLFLARFNIIPVIILFLYSFFSGFYFPAGYIYGKINSGMFFAISETNYQESLEYIQNYSFKSIVLGFLIIVCSIYYLTSYFSYKPKPKLKYNKCYILLFIIMFIILYPGKMIKDSVRQYIEYKNDIYVIKQSLKIPESWNLTKINRKDKNIVVVIGESVTSDYLSLYGYRHETTPFLNNSNGIFINGFIAAGANTSLSLSRTLAQVDQNDKINVSNNAVTLAKKAGYKTYWISNQGVIGASDSAITKIAKFADDTFFLNSMSDYDHYSDDFTLLKQFNGIIRSDADPKVIFIHMYGSHIDPCNRLFDFPNKYKLGYGNKFDCYLSTINKLDTFIELINKNLNNLNKDYSIIYFSDHGQKISNDDGVVNIFHSDSTKQNYHIPFFIIDNKIKSHINKKTQLSALHFLDIFANEIGVQSNKLASDYSFYQIPESDIIKVRSFKKLINYNELSDTQIVE